MLVNHFLENSAVHLPDKVALICGDQRLTYQEINHSADQLASALRDMGIKRQDRVIIFLDNSAESVISLFGILKAGAIFIMLNPTMKAKKLNYILTEKGKTVDRISVRLDYMDSSDNFIKSTVVGHFDTKTTKFELL